MISSILSSCKSVSSKSKNINIDNDKISVFASSLLSNDSIKKKAYPSYPLNYSTVYDECNFIVLIQLLNIGSGYRNLLHKYLNRGAWETILYGCFTMYLSGNILDANFFENFKLFDCTTYFQIPLDYEEYIDNTPIKISKPSLLKPLAEKITFLINDLGRVLRNYQCNNITEFLIKSTEHSRVSDVDEKTENFELIFKRLLTLRGFQDEAVYNGEKVYFYKKAQLVMFSLGKFKEKIPCFDFGNAKLTVFADNVLPAMLISNKLLTVSDELSEKIENSKNVSESEEVELRANTIIVCEKICEIAGCDAADLDEYLWKLGKEGENRVTKRHINMNTFYY